MSAVTTFNPDLFELNPKILLHLLSKSISKLTNYAKNRFSYSIPRMQRKAWGWENNLSNFKEFWLVI